MERITMLKPWSLLPIDLSIPKRWVVTEWMWVLTIMALLWLSFLTWKIVTQFRILEDNVTYMCGTFDMLTIKQAVKGITK